jgi:phosphoribosylaminoimidazole-succinocarboxamide synthase
MSEWREGEPVASFDKQFVRDYLESLGWDKTPPGPELPDSVVSGTTERYRQAAQRICGITLA